MINASAALPSFHKHVQDILPTTWQWRPFGYGFDLAKHGDRYSLSRNLGGFTPQYDLTLAEVEEILELWKLRGPHGG